MNTLLIVEYIIFQLTTLLLSLQLNVHHNNYLHNHLTIFSNEKKFFNIFTAVSFPTEKVLTTVTMSFTFFL